jgi:hypothetical protein
MELEVVSRKKTDSKKVKKGKTSESQGFVFQLENEDEGITASIKSCDDLFEVGDTVEMEIDSHQHKLIEPIKEKKEK